MVDVSNTVQASSQTDHLRILIGGPKDAESHADQLTELYGTDFVELTWQKASNLNRPRYDPDKSVAYTATTLAWVGDPAAERYAREIITRLKPVEDVGKWPRRVASANLDLALTLLVTDRLDEACHAAQQAIESGRVVPSNHWRAAEIIQAVEARQLPEAADLRDAYHHHTRNPTAHADD